MLSKTLITAAIISLVALLLLPYVADAHRSGCHRWHSCPSDSGTYVCGDVGHCSYCPDNQYCKDGRPRAAEAQTKAKAPATGNQQPLAANVLTGKVVRVVDGDTIYVLDDTNNQHRIRLAGIDAPERNQAYGLASGKHLGSLVAGKRVAIEHQKRDRYGRIVGKVWVNGVDACLEQIKAGLAWHYKYYQKEQSPEDRELYAEAENQARAERLGLWREKNPKPPWEHRRRYRSR